MAVGTPTVLGTPATSATSPITTASVSPTAGAVLFAHVGMSFAAGSPTAVFTMGGTLTGTWTLITNSDRVWATRRAAAVYVCTNPGASGTISATYSGVDPGSVQ